MEIVVKYLAAALVVALATPAIAAGDPAATVTKFNAALVETMKDGKALGLSGRTTRLLPQVEATHDMAAMTKLVVGPGWSAMSALDRAALTRAFTRHSTIAYAANFSSFDGQRFEVSPTPELRGADALVRSAIVAKGGTTRLGYRLRRVADTWKIIDVLAEGISQLAVQRSEFAGTLKAGGAAALTAKLDAADTAKLRR